MGNNDQDEAAVFFATPAAFEAWLEEHHTAARELWVGYYKKGSGQPSITWPESVDVALCFGWIDGLRKTIDADRYRIRFTPRKPDSNWSAVNVARVEILTAEGRMRPAGLRAFAVRRADRTAIYSYELRHAAAFDEASEAQLRANESAWTFFSARPPSYRQAAIRWVMSAKKAETRQRRLETLVADSAAGRTVKELTPPSKRQHAAEPSDEEERP
ncbi:MAG: bacteriocin-protection protein [Chloroflexales bacterium]|nr:bacteriocin-protection protein [Chloroflexales bacterium]